MLAQNMLRAITDRRARRINSSESRRQTRTAFPTRLLTAAIPGGWVERATL
jgi:hypothetical protein